jgi:hypothetical protein
MWVPGLWVRGSSPSGSSLKLRQELFSKGEGRIRCEGLVVKSNVKMQRAKLQGNPDKDVRGQGMQKWIPAFAGMTEARGGVRGWVFLLTGGSKYCRLRNWWGGGVFGGPKRRHTG